LSKDSTSPATIGVRNSSAISRRSSRGGGWAQASKRGDGRGGSTVEDDGDSGIDVVPEILIGGNFPGVAESVNLSLGVSIKDAIQSSKVISGISVKGTSQTENVTLVSGGEGDGHVEVPDV